MEAQKALFPLLRVPRVLEHLALAVESMPELGGGAIFEVALDGRRAQVGAV